VAPSARENGGTSLEEKLEVSRPDEFDLSTLSREEIRR
jgi:hypothetical protein